MTTTETIKYSDKPNKHVCEKNDKTSQDTKEVLERVFLYGKTQPWKYISSLYVNIYV